MKDDGIDVLRCAGAPRDLGLDQGTALLARRRELGALADGETFSVLAALRGAIARWMQPRVGTSAERFRARARVARDLGRHFPQLSERLDGLARGAGVARELLVDALALPSDAGAAPATLQGALPAAAALQGALVIGARAAGGARPIARLFARPLSAVLRESRPDNGFASIELVTPFGVAAVVGVSEAGLAAAWAPGDADVATLRQRVVAPAALFVQDALLRFDAVAPARGWCAERPAGGAFVIALADAAGAAAAVRIEGDAREIIELPDAAVVIGGDASSEPPALEGELGEDGCASWLREVVAAQVEASSHSASGTSEAPGARPAAGTDGEACSVAAAEAGDAGEDGVLGVVADGARRRLVVLRREAGVLRTATLEISAKA